MENQIKKSIKKYLKGIATKEEISHLEAFEDFAENKAKDSVFSSEKERKELEHTMYLNISNKIKVPVRKLVIWRYVAAAILIGVLASGYFFKDNLFNRQQINKPIIVNTNNIKIGTDKATLTLEDGSAVILEKGNTYKTQKATSNGEEIVYKAGDQNVSETAYNYLTIPRGGQFHIVLSDGTAVWLNSESQLKYPVNFLKGEIREVDLVYGEAYFDVFPSTDHEGSKFKVLNKFQVVEVLGTEFNIKAYKDEDYIYTTLVEGKVAIEYNEHSETLKPNEQAVLDINDNNFVVADVDVFSEIAWKRGMFSFKNKSLKDIMKVLSRWYDVDVVFVDKSLEDVEFKGVIRKNQNIEDILTLIKNTNFIHAYEINNNSILLK